MLKLYSPRRIDALLPKNRKMNRLLIKQWQYNKWCQLVRTYALDGEIEKVSIGDKKRFNMSTQLSIQLIEGHRKESCESQTNGFQIKILYLADIRVIFRILLWHNKWHIIRVGEKFLAAMWQQTFSWETTHQLNIFFIFFVAYIGQRRTHFVAIAKDC